MSDSGINTQGARIVPAPRGNDPRLFSTILDVVCGLDEDVEWHWTMTDRGQFVSGYSITRRLGKLNVSSASTARTRGTAARKMRSRKRAVPRR